jgi:hypothetical protein
MEQVAAVRWASVIERQDAKLELIRANVAAKKRREDLSILMVDTAGMDDDVREWWKAQRTAILSEAHRHPLQQLRHPLPQQLHRPLHRRQPLPHRTSMLTPPSDLCR